MSVATDTVLKLSAKTYGSLVETYQRLFEIDNRHAPSSETKNHLTNIEYCAGKMIESLVGANKRAVDGILSHYAPALSHADLQKIVNSASLLKSAAHDARKEIYRVKGSRKSAPRAAAVQLRILFASHSIKFSATADEHGGVSQAVALFLEIAHRAGDVDMTLGAARKWIESAKKRAWTNAPREFGGRRRARDHGGAKFESLGK